ncbi:MAG: YceI family protein [Parvularculaceae bacterium]
MRIIALAVLFLAVPSLGAPAKAADYALSEDGASITYSVKTLGFFRRSGAFKKFEIRLRFDEAAPAQSILVADIDMTSATMAAEGATERIKGPAWFDVENYPTSEFRATAIPPLRGGDVMIDGVYKMRGETAPLRLDVRYDEPERDADGEIRAVNIVADGEIDRRVYDMNGMAGLVGRMVGITINARLVRVEADDEEN